MDKSIKKITKKLDILNEKYKIEENKIIIKTDTPLYMYVTFQDDNYEIEGKLMKWNFLTGFLKMSLEKSYKYLTGLITSFIFLIILFSIIYLWKGMTIDLNTAVFGLSILFLIVGWTILTFLYLSTIYTSKKAKIIDWLLEKA